MKRAAASPAGLPSRASWDGRAPHHYTLIDGKTKVESKGARRRQGRARYDRAVKARRRREKLDYMISATPTSSRSRTWKGLPQGLGKAPLVVFELGGVVSANTGPDTVALVYTGHPRGNISMPLHGA